jgi:hypothetical protein
LSLDNHHIRINMNDFRPGDIVGARGWDKNRDVIVSGPMTIHKRPDNPYDQHMWEFTDHPHTIAECELFHWWRPSLRIGAQVPAPPPAGPWRQMERVLKEIPDALEGMWARKVWDKCVNLPFLYGPGGIFAKYFPNVVDPERQASRAWCQS